MSCQTPEETLDRWGLGLWRVALFRVSAFLEVVPRTHADSLGGVEVIGGRKNEFLPEEGSRSKWPLG